MSIWLAGKPGNMPPDERRAKWDLPILERYKMEHPIGATILRVLSKAHDKYGVPREWYLAVFIDTIESLWGGLQGRDADASKYEATFKDILLRPIEDEMGSIHPTCAQHGSVANSFDDMALTAHTLFELTSPPQGVGIEVSYLQRVRLLRFAHQTIEALDKDRGKSGWSFAPHLAYQLTRWAELGFPTVRLKSHRYGAALAMTDVGKTLEVMAPWPCFVLAIPDNLLGDPRYIVVDRMNDEAMGERWSFSVICKGFVEYYRWLRPREQVFSETEIVVLSQGTEWRPGGDWASQRVLNVCTRIAMGTCMAVAEKTDVRQTANRSISSGGRRSKIPLNRTYMVGRPIDLDLRETLLGYMGNKRNRTCPKVQFLVRGHWRQQVCGPRSSQRKTIWVEPFWKGPEAAPINVRPHLKGKT